jgi:hypothetical protein
MVLSIDEVTRIARSVAAKTSPSLVVSGVTLGGGEGSEYVEILVMIDQCEIPHCRISIGMFRNVEPARLEQNISTALYKHVADHSGRQAR